MVGLGAGLSAGLALALAGAVFLAAGLRAGGVVLEVFFAVAMADLDLG